MARSRPVLAKVIGDQCPCRSERSSIAVRPCPPTPVASRLRGRLASVRVSLELPEDAFSALRMTPESFVKEMRPAGAVKWSELGLLSQSKAAEVAGVTRHELLEALSRFKVSPFQTSPEQLAHELGRA